jgi:Protein of unknown function (DUF3768)
MSSPASANACTIAQSSMPEEADHTAEIVRLNDAARAGTLATSRTVLTRALAELLAGDCDDPAVRQVTQFQRQCVLRRLINETLIDPANDPHGTRDFGVVYYLDHKIFWKIDVYENDGTFSWGAEKPWDAAASFRLVTIMLATDY